MTRRKSGERPRLDLRGEAFAAVAQQYRAALRRAEVHWRRLNRNDVQRDPPKAERARRELAAIEEELDAARTALFRLTKRVATDPLRTRVARLELDHKNAEVA